jgi:hypothetical protein
VNFINFYNFTKLSKMEKEIKISGAENTSSHGWSYSFR